MKSRSRKLAAIGLGGLSLAIPLVAAHRVPLMRPGPSRDEPRTPSYWMETVKNVAELPAAEGRLLADVAVIGGGFTGLAVAYYLKRLDPSRDVILLEAQRIGSGASSRNSGAVSPRFRGRAASTSSLRGYELLKSFAEYEGADFDLREDVPAITLYRHVPRDVEPDIRGIELSREIGSTYYAAATTTKTNSIHPGKLINALTLANLRLGVRLFEWSPVQRIRHAIHPTIQTPAATIKASDVVLATNAYTPSLGYAGSAMLAMHHRVIVTRSLTDSEWELSGLERWPLRFEEGGYYTHTVRSTPDRRFFYRHVLGHRAFERTTWAFNDAARQIGQYELVRRYPWLEDVAYDYEWHGITGRTRDWWPIGGRLDEHLYLAAGYNGTGVMPAHYFGFLIAHLVLGLSHEDLDLLKPPEEHPRWPGELLRHLVFHGWLLYQRSRD